MVPFTGMAGEVLVYRGGLGTYMYGRQWYLDRGGISRIGTANRARELESLPSLRHCPSILLPSLVSR